MSRVINTFRALLASPVASMSPSSSAAAARFSSSTSTAAAAKSATSKAAKKTPKKPTTSKPLAEKTATPRTTNRSSGILKVTPVSPALSRFLGVPEASRTDAVKQIWNYIKSHNLQNPTNKREIFCDEKLKTIFEGKEKVGFLEIGKMLSRHFVKSG